MKTARQRILEYIETHGMVTAADLSQAFKITESNARHHLGILRDQGLVKIIAQRQDQKKGRPAQIFGLTQPSQSDNIAGLARALLDLLPEVLPASRPPMQQVARHLAKEEGDIDKERPQNLHLTQRLYHAVEHLNRLNYRARWEAHINAPRMILGYCPYLSILDSHPELCKLDTHLLEELLDEPVEHIARLTPDLRGIPHCIFQIRGG